MKTIYNDVNEWYELFDNKTNEEQYDFVISTLKSPLTESFIEDLDLGQVLVEMKGYLEKEKQFDKLLNLIDICKSSQPAFYKKEHFYFDDFLIDWYLFHQEKERLNEPLTRFEENPVKSIDSMLPILKILLFYGHTDLAVRLAEKTFEPVKNSPELIGNAEYPLAITMYYNYLEQHYKQYLDTQKFNLERFNRKINAFNMKLDPDSLKNIERGLTGNQDIALIVQQEFSKDKRRCLFVIECYFLKYMQHKKRMSFACSGILWERILSYWGKHEKSKMPSPDAFFSFNTDTFDKYLVDVIGSIFGFNKAEGVALLWGTPYVYDFLLSTSIIKESAYQEAIANIYSLKAVILKTFQNDLWRFNFVHRWEPPDKITKEEFLAEEQIFVKSLHDKPKDIREFIASVRNELDKIPDIAKHLLKQMTSAQKQPKIGRNMPCPCGSGKKFKHCCG